MKSSMKIQQSAREYYNNKLYQRYINTACKSNDEVLKLTDSLIKLKSNPDVNQSPEQILERVFQLNQKIHLANDRFEKCVKKVANELNAGHYDSPENANRSRAKVARRKPLMNARHQELVFVDNKYSPFSEFSIN